MKIILYFTVGTHYTNSLRSHLWNLAKFLFVVSLPCMIQSNVINVFAYGATALLSWQVKKSSLDRINIFHTTLAFRWFRFLAHKLWNGSHLACHMQGLTDWGWDKMAVILQMTFWNATKWLPFYRWHFEMHFLEWKCMNFDYYFTEVCS